MDRRLNPRPSVPSSCGALDHGGGQVSNTAEGAKNHWIRTGRHWNLNLATFNTRTLSSEGSLAVLLEELADVKWDIIGLSEVRRTGEAFKVLDSGHILCYRGLPDLKQHGVGFLIHKDIAGNVEEFYSVSERVTAVVVKLNRRYKLKVVQVYAPTASYDDEAVDSFYEDIESAMNKVSTQYSVIMGDFNAKVGQKQVGERAVGSYGIGTRNSRGDMLVNFAEKNKLRVMNTFFNKRKNRKWTWKSPNGETKNEIDFILTANPGIVENVEVLGKIKSSDHRMLRSRIRLDLKRERTKLVTVKKPNLQALQLRLPEFRLTIHNRFELLTEDQDSVEALNDQLTTIISESAVAVGGREPRKMTGKLSQKTKDLIKKRRNMTGSSTRDAIELAELSKLINRSKVTDIRSHNMQMIEETLRRGGGLRSTKKKLAIGRDRMYALRDESGNVTNNLDEILTVAERFYSRLYASISSPGNITARICVEGEAPEITKDEVEMALKAMKRGKAAGDDGITVDLLKDGGYIVLEKLAKLFSECLRTTKVPQAWKNANMILVHKKGDVKDLRNYRPISLLSVVYKLFTKVILNRISDTLDFNQPREQAGFRKGYSTMDHIHVVNQIIEKSAEYNKPLYMAFIDYEKAFDSVETAAVVEALRYQGVENTYITLLEDIYSECTGTLILHKKTEKFPIKKGVRQGDTISPKLFTACLEGVFRKLDWDELGIRVDGEYLSNLRFADDIVLISESGEDLQRMIQDLHSESSAVGLKINMKKSKVMSNCQAVRHAFRLGNEILEQVDEYNYLGQVITAGQNHEKEIRRRISMGWSAFGKHYDIMSSRLPLSLKRLVFNQCVLPVLTYGAETWGLTKLLERKLRSAQRAMERKMVGVTLRDRKRASWIREQTQVEDILAQIKRKKWRWAGHVMRRIDNRWTTRTTEWVPRDGIRSKGRPKTRWIDEIRKFGGKEWTRAAQDRDGWRSLGEAFVLQWT